jgi:hypothetical protein
MPALMALMISSFAPPAVFSAGSAVALFCWLMV